MQYFEAQTARGGKLIVADPRRTATAAGRDAAPAADAGQRRGAGQRAAARRDPRQADRRGLHRRAHRGLRRGAPRRRILVAGPGGARDRRAGAAAGGGRAPAGRGRARLHDDRPRAGAAEPRRRQCARLHQPGAGARQGRASGTAAGARSPGRATARAAASTARRRTSCRAIASLANPAHRAHVAEVWGVEPETLPPPGPPACELLARCGGEIARAAGVRLQPAGRRRPAPASCAGGWRRSTCWSSPTLSCPRPRRSPTWCCRSRSGRRRRAR